MLPIAMEIEGETDERSNLFDRLQSLACFEEDDEDVDNEKISSNLTVTKNETGKESFFQISSQEIVPAISLTASNNDQQNDRSAVENDEKSNSNANKTIFMQPSLNNDHKYDTVGDGLNFFIKTELPDTYDDGVEEQHENFPSVSGLSSLDAGSSTAAVDYEMKLSTALNGLDPFELMTISKRQATISVHTVQREFVPPIRKRGRKKKVFSRSVAEPVTNEVKKPPKQIRTQRFSSSTLTSNSRKFESTKNKSAKVFAELTDVGNVDDVLQIWEAKMELQAACGFTASENLSVDQVANEARNRIESLHYQFTSACTTSKQLLRQQFELAKRISNPLGLEEVSLVKKKRIRPKYAEMIANGLMLPPQEYNQYKSSFK